MVRSYNVQSYGGIDNKSIPTRWNRQIVVNESLEVKKGCIEMHMEATLTSTELVISHCNLIYRKTSCISRTEFQNSNVSSILLQLSSLNPLKPGVKLRMKM